MKLKDFQQLGMNVNSDKFILTDSYTSVAEEPFYKGDGNHSVEELQQICNQFKEYCHQQRIIKSRLINEIKGLDGTIFGNKPF